MKHEPIFETEHWQVFLHPNQSELGRLLIPAKAVDRSRLPDVTDEEWINLVHAVIPVCEETVARAFGATLFNWSCLMNLAYQNDPPDPHVHWHMRPRYREPAEFGGERFVDQTFGHHYDPKHERKISDELYRAIVKKIRDSIPHAR